MPNLEARARRAAKKAGLYRPCLDASEICERSTTESSC